MKKDAFISLAAIIVAGFAAYIMFPREESGTSPVIPQFDNSTILGEEDEILETTPTEDRYLALRNTQQFLSEVIPRTGSIEKAQGYLTPASRELLPTESNAFVNGLLTRLDLPERPTSFRILTTTELSETEVRVSTEFTLPDTLVVREIPVINQDGVWLISLE
jgi:hypothetical protein